MWIGNTRRLLPLWVACCVMVMGLPCAWAAVPPSDEVEGYDEYIKTKEYPRRLSLSGHAGARVVIPTPGKAAPSLRSEFPPFAVTRDTTGGPGTVKLAIGFGGNFHHSSSLYTRSGHEWILRNGDLTPIFGHIYRSSQVGQNSVLGRAEE